MNARLVKLVLALGTLVLTTSWTARTYSTQTQVAQKVAQGNTQTTTGDVRIDGSSTVYPITQAIARSAVPKGQSLKRLNQSKTRKYQ